MTPQERFWAFHYKIEATSQKEEQQALSEEFQAYYSALNEKEKDEVKTAHARVMEEYRARIKPVEALIEQFNETYRTRFPELA